MANPYETLGVAVGASTDDIKKSYRRLARKLHPDLNPGDKAAEEKFKDVANAYRLLSDPETRRRFDAGEIDETGAERPRQRYYRDYAGSAQDGAYASDAGFADFMDGDDPFAELLRRSAGARTNRRGQDLHYRLPMTLGESITGGTRRLVLPTGDTLDVTVPPGVVDGQTLRLRGKGGQGFGKGAAGDALIELEVMPDSRFVRDGDDLLIDLPISLTEAILGAKVPAPTPTGEVNLSVPPGTDGSSKLRVKGHGVPRRGGGRGDLFVRPRIVLPTPIGPELKDFAANWSQGRSSNPREEST